MNGQSVLRLAWKCLKFRPAPKAVVALYLSLRWGARVSLSADITYPFRLRLGRGVRLGRCRIHCAGDVMLEDHVRIHDGVILDASGAGIVLGKEVTINPYCALWGIGGIRVGRHTGVGMHTTIVAFNHGTDDLEVPMMRQPMRGVGISIAENVWIGARCVILDGVTIAEGAVVAAGAVVTRDVGREDVVAGVPARVIKNRRREAARRAAASAASSREPVRQ